MSFVITVKMDASTVDAAIPKMKQQLESAEQAGEKLSKTLTKSGREGATSMDAIGRSARSVFGQLDQLSGVAKAFAPLTSEFERQHRILEQIHGPMREHMADVQSLNMLMKNGAITAGQYADQIERSRKSNGIRSPMDAVSLPSPAQAPSASSGALSGLSGAITAGAAIYGAKEVLDLSDSYTSLQNRLRQVAGSQENLNVLMHRTREIADGTRSDWATTAESYVRLANATKDMGLSQERGLAITETLSMALQTSGASASEAASGTLQLMQALSSGRLQGDEFRSMAENLPGLMDVFSKELGVTRGQLREMGAQGKITTDIIVRGLEHASASIHEGFGKAVPTAAQQWTVFKNQLTETAGEFVQSSHLVEILGSALHTLGSILGPLGTAFGYVAKGVGLLKDAVDVLGFAGKMLMLPFTGVFGLLGDLFDGFGSTSAAARGLMTDVAGFNFDHLNEEILKINGSVGGMVLKFAEGQAALMAFYVAINHSKEIAASAGALGGAETAMAATTKLALESVDSLKAQREQLDAIEGPQRKYHREVDALNALLHAGTITQYMFDKRLKEIEASFHKVAKAAHAARVDIALFNDIESSHRAIAHETRRGNWNPAPMLNFGDNKTEIDSLEKDLAVLVDQRVAALRKMYDTSPLTEYKDALEGIAAVQSQLSDAALERFQFAAWEKYIADLTRLQAATVKWNNELYKTDAVLTAMSESLISSVGSFSDLLVDAANGANVSWAKFFHDTMVGLEKLLLKSTLLEALTGSVDGSKGAGVHGGYGGLLGILGGANGFDSMVPGGSGPFLPGSRPAATCSWAAAAARTASSPCSRSRPASRSTCARRSSSARRRARALTTTRAAAPVEASRASSTSTSTAMARSRTTSSRAWSSGSSSGTTRRCATSSRGSRWRRRSTTSSTSWWPGRPLSTCR